MKNISMFALLAAIPALGLPVQALAAEAGGVEEIVVTAQRRTETLQKSSLALQVLSSEEITRSGLSSVTDLNTMVPGIQIGTAGGATQIFIRGVGDFSASQTSSPGVAINLNGVYVGHPQATGANFYDLERVEVVKGPQGTLYGRNASGGAMNIITRKPDFSGFSGYMTFEAGNYELKHGTGAVNLPIGDKLAIRAAFNVVDRDGYMSDGTDDDKQEAGRLMVAWRPTDAISNLTTIDFSHVHGKGPGYSMNPRAPGTDHHLGSTDPVALNYLANYSFLGAIAAFGVQPFSYSLSGPPPFADRKAWSISDEFQYDMGWATLTLLPSYRDFRDEERSYEQFQNYQNFHASQFSAEARLNKDSEKIKWVAGLYYYYDDVMNGRGFIDNGTTLLPTSYPVNTTRAYAVFGHMTYSVLKDLRIILGARYTLENHHVSGSQPVTVVVAPGMPTFPNNFDGKQKNYALTWKGGLEYDITPQNMVFFTASTGFKAGGVNFVSPTNTYGPEKLTAYELGFRNRFLDNKLQVNVELFKWDYNNHQEGVLVLDANGANNFVTLNAGPTSLEGGNIDVVAKVTPHDTFRAFAEYNYARYIGFVFDYAAPPTTTCPSTAAVNGLGQPVTRVDCSNYPVAAAPRYVASASWEHVFEFGNGAQLIAFASANYMSARFATVTFEPNLHFPANITGNFDLTYTPDGGRWSLTGFVHNIGDEVVPTGGLTPFVEPKIAPVTLGPPRTYGGRLTVNF